VDNIARDRDIIDRALELNPKFTRKDYEEVFKSFKSCLKEQVKGGEHTAYKFLFIGTMYIKMDNCCKRFFVRGRTTITNWQIRYEKLIKEVMERTLTTYKSDVRLSQGFLHRLKKVYGFSVEDIEEIQNEEFNK
jgi:hypothetical protein